MLCQFCCPNFCALKLAISINYQSVLINQDIYYYYKSASYCQAIKTVTTGTRKLCRDMSCLNQSLNDICTVETVLFTL